LLISLSRSERYDLQKDGKTTAVVDMMARIRREGTCEQMTLYRFDRETVETLIDKTLSPAMFTEDFYDLVFGETNGNPLFVSETLQLMQDNGSIFFNDGAWYNKQGIQEIAVPSRVEDVFLRRLSALTEDEREILQVAAIIGYAFDPSLLAKLIELSKINLLKRLKRVESELQIITSADDGFRFEHPMLQELLYQEMPQMLRKEYHLMVVADFEERFNGEYGSYVGEVAQHLRQGGQHAKAAPLLYQAALRSFKRGAFREAGVYITEVMDSDEQGGGGYAESVAAEELYLK
jgi:predicted ATPase